MPEGATVMTALRYEMKKASKAAKFAVAHIRSRPCVLVYQMGKVGSRTITETLRAAAPDLLIYHVHVLTEEGLQKAEARYRRAYPWNRRVAQHFIEGRYLQRRLENPTNWPWRVITLVRDPVALNISAFFQTLRYHPDLALREWSPEYQEALQERFLRAHPHREPLEWLDRELNQALGVDVYSRRFPHERGYDVYSSDRASALVIRLEDLSSCGPAALSSFLGIEPIELTSSNVAAAKRYADVYATFIKELKLPPDYVESMYDSKFARHFYTESELAGFRRKWSKAG